MADKKDKEKPSPLAEEIQRKFFEKRQVFFWGDTSDENCSRAIEKILYLDATDSKKPITLFLNSPGGSVTAGLAMYETLCLMKSPLDVVVTGMAASMGSILLCAAHGKGKRLIYPHARVLIHQPLIAGRIVAPAVDIDIHAREIERQRGELNLILQKCSGQPIEQIEKDTDRDFYMNAQEAIDYGLVDEIVTTI